MSPAKVQKAIKLAEMLMEVMSKQKFADWYEFRFVEHIQGGENAPKFDEVKTELARMIAAQM